MSSRYLRIAEQLGFSLARFGVRGAATAVDDGVSISWQSVQQIRSAIAFIEGGNRTPFVNSLLRGAQSNDVVLRGDEPHHLRRALDDLWHQKTRNEQIDRGQIPGALSGAEVSRLVRRNPYLFTGRTRKGQS